MMDPHCVGIDSTMFSSIGQPDVIGNFHYNYRIIMKWRQPIVDTLYSRIGDRWARIGIDLEAHTKASRTVIRLLRYDLNRHEVDLMASYRYINHHLATRLEGHVYFWIGILEQVSS